MHTLQDSFRKTPSEHVDNLYILCSVVWKDIKLGQLLWHSVDGCLDLLSDFSYSQIAECMYLASLKRRSGLRIYLCSCNTIWKSKSDAVLFGEWDEAEALGLHFSGSHRNPLPCVCMFMSPPSLSLSIPFLHYFLFLSYLEFFCFFPPPHSTPCCHLEVILRMATYWLLRICLLNSLYLLFSMQETPHLHVFVLLWKEVAYKNKMLYVIGRWKNW